MFEPCFYLVCVMRTTMRYKALFSVAGLAAVLLVGCDSGIDPQLPDDYAADEAPAWSPDGSRIAYFHWETSMDREGGYPTGLYVLDLASGERSLVIEGNVSNPDWSPDGERIAFDADDLFTVKPDGSDLQRVTSHGSAFFPRYSPDGATLSYGRSGTQEVVGLWFTHLADSIFTRFGFGASPADWSPDGRRIVYEGPQGEAGGGNQIWVADTSGANRIQLTLNFFINRNPAWSPGGEWIAWTALYGGEHEVGFAVWLMRTDGSEPRELVERGGDAAWSPDSERLVFSGPVPDRSKSVLWSIRRDGSDLRQLTF